MFVLVVFFIVLVVEMKKLEGVQNSNRRLEVYCYCYCSLRLSLRVTDSVRKQVSGKLADSVCVSMELSLILDYPRPNHPLSSMFCVK